MGGFKTPRDRAEAAALGEDYQRRILRVLPRGVTPAAIVLLASVVFFIVAENR